MAEKNDRVADAIGACFISPNVPDSNFEAANVVDVIAGAGHNISRALKALGNGTSDAPMGAIEFLAVQVREGSSAIASALSEVAAAIRDRE